MVKIDGFDWALFWLFCITLNTCSTGTGGVKQELREIQDILKFQNSARCDDGYPFSKDMTY